MNTIKLLPALLLAMAGTAQAQSAPCPHLDVASGLAWEHRAGPDYDFCRALDAAGMQVLGVYVGQESPFEPDNDNRAERGTIDGREITWYRSEVVGEQAQVRETLVELRDGRVAHIWLRADNTQELAGKLQLAQSLSFQPVQLTGQ